MNIPVKTQTQINE